MDEDNILPEEEEPKAIILQDECDRRSQLVKTLLHKVIFDIDPKRSYKHT